MSSNFSPEIIASLLPILKGRNEGYVNIYETELTGSVASITISNIPQNYRDLILSGNFRSDHNSGQVDALVCRYNGLTGTNYQTSVPTWQGLTDTHSQSLNDTKQAIGLIEIASSRSNTGGFVYHHWLDYSDTTYEQHSWGITGTGYTYGGTANNYYTRIYNCAYQGQIAISTLLIYPLLGSNLVTGTRFKLWAIK